MVFRSPKGEEIDMSERRLRGDVDGSEDEWGVGDSKAEYDLLYF